MTAEDFVKAIRNAVERPAARDSISQYESPSGRAPSPSLVQASVWYNSLSASDQAMVKEVAEDVAQSAVFGFFCVLDSVRAVEDRSDKGDFELWYVNGENRVLVNSPSSALLHDLYNAS